MAVFSPEVSQSRNDTLISALVVGGLITASTFFSQVEVEKEPAPDTLRAEQVSPNPIDAVNTKTRASVGQYENIFDCGLQSDMNPYTTHTKWASPKEQTCAKYIAAVIGKNTYNWGPRQHKALVALWTRESAWSANADNPYSSAFGIPQAMTSKKLHGPEINQTFGKGPYSFYKNPVSQIQWGIDYIHERYGTPMAANRFWYSKCDSSYGCWY